MTTKELPFAGIMRPGNGVIASVNTGADITKHEKATLLYTYRENKPWTKRIGYFDKLWPTPMARLGTVRGPQAKRYTQKGRSIDLDDAVAHFGENDAPQGVTAARSGTLWPTPTAREGKSGAGHSEKRTGGMNLRTAVLVRETFPTPTVQDSANNGGPAQSKRNSLPLNAIAGGSLNPSWVEWLMGFEEGWTK